MLISFNLVLGLVAVPTAVVFARAQPRILSAVGIAVFAGVIGVVRGRRSRSRC